MRTAILSGVLFLSGCAALLFETLWLRLTGLVFGNTVWSAALILSSFMTGLALGNGLAAFGRVRPRNALRLYAMLEIAIAVFGCALVFALPQLGAWLRPLFRLLSDHDTALNALRLVVSFLVLLVPTTAMGLTLPVALDDPGLREQEFGRAIGFLYGWNTLGAVVGALAGEAVLVKEVGLFGTAGVAGLFNLGAAAVAFTLAQKVRPEPRSAPVSGNLPWRQVGWRSWRLLVICFGTGGVLLCLEVVWFRFLRLYVAASSTAFAIMLAAVLIGIGIGGVVAGAVHRRGRSLTHLLPQLLLGAAILTLLSYILFPGPQLQRVVHAFYLDRWNEIALLSLALIFPVAFFSGVLFPAIAAAVQTTALDRLNTAGAVTLFNTTGAAVGPVVAGFVLLPAIGFERSLVGCGVVYALLALFASERTTWSVRTWRTAAMWILAATFVVAWVRFPYRRDEVHFANSRTPYEHDGERLVKKIEGTADTLQLLNRSAYGEPYYYRLLTNGFSMSATTPKGQRYMRLFAYLPAVFRPQSEDALLICYGLGATADALVRNQRLRKIDVVDISTEVLDLADDHVGPDYANPLRDPRVTKFVQDGRFYLQACSRRYDIITGEPPPPKVIGSVNLYTEQFFSLMRSRLKEGGVASFWLPIYQMRLDEVKAILRAFHNAFPNASVWAGPDEEWIMVGINGAAVKVDDAELQRLWSAPPTAVDLARIGVETPAQLPALFVMDGAGIDALTNGMPPLTDSFPKRLTDEPADTMAIHQFAENYFEPREAARRFRGSALMQTLWSNEMQNPVELFLAVREERFLATWTQRERYTELDFYLRRTSLREPVLELLDNDEFRLALAEKAAQTETEPSVELLWDLVGGALARRDYSRAVELMERRRSRGVARSDESVLLIYIYCLNGQVEKANEFAAAEARNIPVDPALAAFWRKLQADFGFRPPA